MRLPSSTAAVLAAAALPLALTACSSGSPGSSDSSSSGSATHATAKTTKTTKDPDAGLKTGTQLKKALAPASFFASGFAVDPSGVRDTGTAYTSPSSADTSKPDCAKLNGTGWIDVTGVTGVSFAQNDYVNKDTSADIAQEIDAFRGTTAAGVVKSLEKIVAQCPEITDSQTHSKVRISGATTAGLGDSAYTITLTDSAWENGTTLIAARVGTDVVSVMSTDGHDNGAGTAKKLTSRIITTLRSMK